MLRPAWRIIGERHEVVLVPWGGEPEANAVRLGAGEARRALDALLAAAPTRGLAARALAEAARYVSARHDRAGSLRARDARATVAEALARGVLAAWRAPLRRAPAPTPEESQPEDDLLRIPLASSLLRTWIELELLDEEGRPVAGEPYWIKLPDGTVREGALDRYGLAYIGDIDPGVCEVRWPALEGEALAGTSGRPVSAAREAAIERAQRASAPSVRTWVEFALVDAAGAPVAGELCVVKLPDGSAREAVTDAAGVARFDDLDPGTCVARWPRIDDPAVLDVTAL